MKIGRPVLMLLALWLNACAREYTTEERVQQFGGTVRQRLAPRFAAARVPYPPAKVTLIGFKQERELQLYAAGTNGVYHWIRSYPILAASGTQGPKLRQGDRQVPEGLYRIESLNPNSRYHLALRVNYPNAFDRAQAEAEGRGSLGGDIMIHGNAVSIGCLAMGDTAAEDLFVLAAVTGVPNVLVILSPVDFRVRTVARYHPGTPPWVPALYATIQAGLRKYERPQEAPPVVTPPPRGRAK